MDTTPVARMMPPARPPDGIARPTLMERLATALTRRLTTVVAEAGYGKSTLAASWWETGPCAWYTADTTDLEVATLAQRLGESLRLRVPELPAELIQPAEGSSGSSEEQIAHADALGSRLARVLHTHLAEDLLLVVDDVDELGAATPSARLVEALCRHAPARLHLVLVGRRGPPFPVERLRGQGQLLEIGGAQLAFSAAEVEQLVAARLGTRAAGLVGRIFELAGGWPAAVVLAVEALRATPEEMRPSVLAAAGRGGAPLVAYLAEEVFARQPPEVRELVATAAVFDQFSPELFRALGIGGSGELLDRLSRASLFVEMRQDGSLALRPLIREYARQHLPIGVDVARGLRLRGAEWLAANGSTAAALRTLIAAGEPRRLAEMLEREGQRLLAAGEVGAVMQACGAIPAGARSARVDELEGEARQIQGDWQGALACFERAANGLQPLPAHLAWRIGLIHYLRGPLDEALGVFRQGLEDAAADPLEMSLLSAWTAAAHWARGEVEACRSLARQALSLATAGENPRALAAAHTVMAMLAALDGDRRGNDAHYLLALRAAEEAGDVLQTVRIRTNRGSHFMEEGSYTEALQELDVAIRLAETTSFASFLALGLCNRGETKLRMGRLDEALSDLEASRARCQQIEADMIAYPLTLIGEAYRERGNLAQARAAYEEAVAVAERSGDQQGLVPALAGLATVLAREEPDRAGEVVSRAVTLGTGMGYVAALLAAGWVAAVTGDHVTARRWAGEAAAVARKRRDRAGLAEALVLDALTASEPRTVAGKLREASEIYGEIGNALGAAVMELAQAVVEPQAGSAARRRAAERRLDELGVHGHRGGAAAGMLAMLGGDRRPAVQVRSLGGFTVLRGGEPVRLSEWQSRRARDLLKLLVARRGRPVTRGYLMETLWPDEDPEKVANRLSVALTTVRTVLYPERDTAPEHLLADKEWVALNLEAIDVDLESFHSAASTGMRLLRGGDVASALPLLETAAAVYSGDFLEENPYDEWAVPAREEARAACVEVVRALAEVAAARRDADAGMRHLLRILEMDRYDEAAHLALVELLSRAGRHGEAHRHYMSYRRAMDELGVEPSAFPSDQTGRGVPAAGDHR
jgi:ATP/maltotriose-dependent transcriptional regulator MalT/DNA-binding SARP family transcriptional activator